MPIAKIQLPDGRIAKFEVAEGTSPDQVVAFANQQFGQKNTAKDFEAERMADVVNDMSTTDRLLAGAGKAFADAGTGIRQVAGPAIRMMKGTSPEESAAARSAIQSEIEEDRKRQAPLMETTAGKVGNVGGNIALALPAMAIPGANTAAGAALIGGGLGFIQPTAEGESRALNTLLSGASGIAGHQLGAKVIPGAINWAKGRIATAAAQKSANAAKDATLAAGRQAGYVLPPSEVRPGAISSLLERWAGKASVGQAASLKNQQVTNKLVRESLKLPKDTPITPETLTPIKQAAWGVYDQVRSVGTVATDNSYKQALAKIGTEFNKLAKEFPELANSQVDDLINGLSKDSISSDGAVELIKQLRFQANTNLNPMNFNPAAKTLGKAQKAAADAVEDLIERSLKGTGSNLLKDFRNARVTLGKVGTVEKAMVESTGDVSARKLASELAKGKPLTGELRTAAKFAQAFPRFNQMNVNPVPGGSPLDAMAAIGTSAATGNPGWLALALGRPAARSAVLSPVFNRPPTYGPGLMTRAIPPTLGLLNQPGVPQAMGLLAPSIYAAQE